MDTNTLAQQAESVERNIAFLQKEHQVLLTGLRLEIRHLKKRCNGLSLSVLSLTVTRLSGTALTKIEMLHRDVGVLYFLELFVSVSHFSL